MLPEYWNNQVTLFSKEGDNYVRAGVYYGCFWARRCAYVYDNGVRHKVSTFVCRLPYVSPIEPGDILALGSVSGDINEYVEGERASDFLASHRGCAFRVMKSSSSLGGRFPSVKCEGRDV